jgi:hypothetical protein
MFFLILVYKNSLTHISVFGRSIWQFLFPFIITSHVKLIVFHVKIKSIRKEHGNIANIAMSEESIWIYIKSNTSLFCLHKKLKKGGRIRKRTSQKLKHLQVYEKKDYTLSYNQWQNDHSGSIFYKSLSNGIP